jgi:hypothetical protein
VSAVIFAGPSLPATPPLPSGVRLLPPARLGDVYRATLDRPRVIGLIDGYFEAEPPPRHKEILWALAQGIHVLGAASIGALRAAELAAYGMEPVGAVAAAYREGTFAGLPFGDDDEVALLHGPAAMGYPAMCEALVNIRATLAAAVAHHVVSPDTARAMVALGKRRFFKERSYPALLDDARAAGLPTDALDALEAWLPTGRVDQKRIDAATLVARAAELLAGDAAAPASAFIFQPTESWYDLVAAAVPPATGASSVAAIEEELLLDPPLRRRCLRRALADLLVEREAQRRGLPAGDADALPDLYAPLLLRRLSAMPDPGDEWTGLLARIAAKQQALARLGGSLPTLGQLGVSETGLVRDHAGRHGLPRDLEVERYAALLGFAGGDALIAALLRDHLARTG